MKGSIGLRGIAAAACAVGIVAALWLFWAQAVPAQEKTDWFAALRGRLAAEGFAAEELESLYRRPEVFLDAEGVARFFVHSEAKLNYDQFSTPESIERAQRYIEQYRAPLEEAESRYGVDRRVVTAILLVESRLGTIAGSRSCLNILSTLAALTDPAVREAFWKVLPSERRLTREQFDERVAKRAEWGYRELTALLRYAARERIDPAALTSSYAGAVGFAQFMPTNILAYGQDGDGDGAIDLFSHADAIASIANYLKRHGWQPGLSRERAEKAIHAYNPSRYYVQAILKVADLLKG